MQELYNELLERETYLKSIEQTEQVKTRLSELMLVMVRVQQLLIPLVVSTFVCVDCKEQTKDVNDGLCYNCWGDKHGM